MGNKRRPKRKRAPYLVDMGGTRVGDAFRHITAHKEDYIVRENGKVVELKEAVRRYKETGDDKWLLHILATNVGYFANTLGKAAARFGVDPSDYVFGVYEGLKYALSKCDPERVRISYLASGVYIICVREIDRELRMNAKKVDIDAFLSDGDDEAEERVCGERLDRLLAYFGIYDVPLYDEDTCETHDGED